MKSYTYDGYTLTLTDTGESKPPWHVKVRYTLAKAGEDQPIFDNDDFAVPFGQDREGPEAAANLIGFLTCQEGDVEPEYFADYTARQLAFAADEAEELQLWEYALVCPDCGTVEPDPPDDDIDWVTNPPAWAMGTDPTRCSSCGSLVN